MLSNDISAAGSPPPSVTSGNGSSSRLIVDHVVLENFKSYAGRQVIGPFHANFTAIVGPNGSGKSNVIDAFMFVLGYRARKLRQSKLSELIHNSEGLLELESCAVEFHFSLLGGADGAVQDTLVISRTAYRNNASKYTINGHASSYTDVTRTLREHGVDLDHKRFLILQGEVESIAQMKPKAGNEHEEGLLEYLEDIIGTNRYIEPIAQAGRAVDAANDQCAEKHVRVRAAEREVAALQEEKQAAEDFIRQENELVAKKAELLQVLRHQAEAQAEQLTGRLEEARAKLAREEEASSSTAQEAKALEAAISAQAAQHRDREASARSAAQRLSTCEKEDITLQETRKHVKGRLKALARATAEESRAKASAQHELQHAEQELAGLAASIAALERAVAEEDGALQAITASLRGRTGALQGQLDALQQQMAPWTEQIRHAQDALEAAAQGLAAQEQKQRAQATEQAELEARLQAAEAELAAAEDARAALARRRAETRAEMARCEAEIAAGEAQQGSLGAAVASVQQTLAEANAALRQGGAGSAALAALLAESAAGRIGGVHGRLGDLGSIEGRWEVAVGAASSMLDHIVVDRAATGQQCVALLRARGLGRASFLILERMRPAAPRPADLPADATRLFDLVQPRAPPFRDAFYHALADTLVAVDMDEATRLAYGQRRRFRVVTLDGRLLDTSGTIAGGGTPRQHRGMRAGADAPVTPAQLLDLNALLNTRLAEQQAARTLLAHVREQLSRAALEHRRAELEAARNDIACRAIPPQLADLREQAAAARALITAGPPPEERAHVDALQAQAAAHAARIAALREAAAPVQAAIDACQAQVLEAGGTRFKAQRTKVSDLRDQLRLQERRRAALVAQHAALRRQTAPDDADAPAEALRAAEAELRALDAHIERVTCDAFAATQEHAQLSAEAAAAAAQLHVLTEQHAALAPLLARSRRLLLELQRACDALALELQAAKDAAQAHAHALAQLAFGPVQCEDAPPPALPVLAPEALRTGARGVERLRAAVHVLEAQLAVLRPNLGVLAEHRLRVATWAAARDEHVRLEAARDAARAAYDALREQRHAQFMAGLRQIALRLKELYQLVTLGGNAELELVDSLDPFAEGILFSVLPPRKSWKSIANLSGGERTLASLALVFALHAFRPTPIYVMDEIDAALDFRNVSIVASYIRERTHDAQFIVISLRNDMFERADRLVGVYKTRQRTRSVAIDPRTFSVGAFIHQQQQQQKEQDSHAGTVMQPPSIQHQDNHNHQQHLAPPASQ